jgi:hypothetical protein
MTESVKSFVSTQRSDFEEQRKNVLLDLTKRSEYPRMRQESDQIFSKIVVAFNLLGLNETNAVLAIDGSFSYGMALTGGDHASDVDGVIFLLDDHDCTDVSRKVDDALTHMGIKSNVHVISSSWKPEGRGAIARAEALCSVCIPLLAGTYIWGSYKEDRVIQMLQGQEDALRYIPDVLEERFLHMYNVEQTTYKKRLSEHRLLSSEQKG